MSGRQLDRGLELANRPGELVGLEVHEAEVDPERRVGAVLAHQRLVHLGGAAEIAELEVGEPEQVLRLLVARAHLVGALEVIARLVHLPLLEQLAPAVERLEEDRVAGLRRVHRHDAGSTCEVIAPSCLYWKYSARTFCT